MKFFLFITILSFLFFFTKNQKPENVTLYQISCNNDCSYEYKVLKGEIFGFEFSRGRGTPCYWTLLNRNLFNESYTIQFLKSYTYDYLSEAYQKALEKQKEEEGKEKVEGTEIIIKENIEPIDGGSELYYEVFKALHETNHPQTLNFIYTCGFNDIYQNVYINIWICDEIYENKCINKIKCSEIESPSKENCENFNTSNEELKCIFDENNNKCTEKKICSLVVNEPEINCEKATTLNIKTKCIYDEKQKKCKESNRICSEIIKGANNEICSSASTEKNICLYDKDLKQCIEKSICLSALNIKDEKDCSSLPTSDDIRLKCTIKIEGNKKSCMEEEKKCLEIINGATEEICSNSKTSEDNRICILDNRTLCCNETIKEDGGKYNNLSFILFIILLIF